jgi:phosphotransferase system HPr (HPr) family protein
MDQPKATRIVVVTNRAGLHARSALMVYKLAQAFPAKIEIVMDRQRASANDMLELLSLGAAQGTELTLEASGQGADAALEALAGLFAAGFHEEDA